MKKTLFAKYVAKHCRIVLPTETQTEPSVIFHMVPAEGWFNKLLAKTDPSINLAKLTKETLLVHSDNTTFTYPCEFYWSPENPPISNWDEVIEARVKLQKAMKKLEPQEHSYITHTKGDVRDNQINYLSLQNLGHSAPSAPLANRVKKDKRTDELNRADTSSQPENQACGSSASDCSSSSGE